MITGTAAQCGVVLDGKDFLVTGTQLQPKCQNCNMIDCVALDSEYDSLTFVHMWLFYYIYFFPLKNVWQPFYWHTILLSHRPIFKLSTSAERQKRISIDQLQLNEKFVKYSSIKQPKTTYIFIWKLIIFSVMKTITRFCGFFFNHLLS